MLKSLWQETASNLGGAISPEEGSDSPNILTTLGALVGQEFFTGVDPNTGATYTTLPAAEATNSLQIPPSSRPISSHPEAVNGKQSKTSVPPTQAERTIQQAESLVDAITTMVFAPLAMPLNAIAIKAGMVPQPEELLGPMFEKFASAAEAFQAIPELVQSNPQRREAIASAVQLAMSTAIPLPGGDVTWSVPTAGENRLALEQAQRIARQVIEEMGDTSCPHCLKLPCACGAHEILLDIGSVTRHIEPITTQHNLGIAQGAAEDAFIQGVQKRSAALFKDIVQGSEIELLHIPPSSLLTGALLNDWKLLPAALIASIIPNETGKRGATITVKSRPANQGGDKLVVSMAEIGRGADSGTFPLTALPSWSQSTLQSTLSDHPWMRKIWDKSEHGSTPEIGTFTITNPGNQTIHQDIPLAVRFPRGTKPTTGGAGILGAAITELGGIQKFISDVAGANLASIPLTQNDAELTRVATNSAAQDLADHGMRPGVVARKAQEILTAIFENTDSRPTLTNIANSVMQERQQKLTAETRHHDQQRKLQLALKNLQNSIEYDQVLSAGQFLPSGRKDVYVRKTGTKAVVPLTQVYSALVKEEFPPDWEVVTLPTPEVNQAIMQTAIEEIQTLKPTSQLWRSALNGDIPLEGINRTTIARAMAQIANSADDTPDKVQPPKRTLGQKAADNIDALVALITPRRESK